MEKKLTILAVGAHANEMEKTCPFLTKYAREGHKIIVLNCTSGESGHPTIPSEAYKIQKREEAKKIAEIIRLSEQRYLPFVDGLLPVSDEAKWMICDVIREVKPDIVVTHWKGSFHKDHKATYELVQDAMFLASLSAMKRQEPAHTVQRVFYTENWEDADKFTPNVFVEIDDISYDIWEKATLVSASSTGALNGFMSIDFYRGLLKMRGAQSGVFKYAQAVYTPIQIITKDIFAELGDIETIHNNFEIFLSDLGK